MDNATDYFVVWSRVDFYALQPLLFKEKTRMHSSRMRTGRSLTVCRSLLLPVGGVSAPGVGWGGCLLRGGGGGVCYLGGSGPGVGGGGVSQHALRQTLPHLWTEFLTHASENITLAQLRCGR